MPRAPRWRARIFRPAAEGALRRRPRDWFGLVVGLVLLVLASLHHGDVTPTERAIFELFDTLPAGLAPLFRALYRLGALWALRDDVPGASRHPTAGKCRSVPPQGRPACGLAGRARPQAARSRRRRNGDTTG